MTDDTERITVGEEAENGESVSMPVIDVLAGRGFITGKSGSGKSNTASVVAEQLLEAGYGLLIVDVDGEYYGLKEEYELLHAGADEECDIQVSPEHAEKLATLALEENVPIILDVSSYLDTEAADEMLLAVARQLFAKAKKQKKPFLVLVEECHEYIPEGGGMTETGKMLIKIGKRGRKHGLGIVGMSQRPADVKKDFITQCDWMVWHRLTWDNDTRVVGRILGNSYADRVEDLGDGGAFLVTDWSNDVRRVQFNRKRTFDAGATPGLEEFERPELQSVSEDLVADLQQVSEERQRHESELSALEAQLEAKEQRIEELEAELVEARDMSEMADRFATALVENAESSPPENAPAEPEVAEAEEFVADPARGGYPGEKPVQEVERPPSEPGTAGAPQTAAEDESPATEPLSEDQRELHDYERETGEPAAVEERDPPASADAGSTDAAKSDTTSSGEADVATTASRDADSKPTDSGNASETAESETASADQTEPEPEPEPKTEQSGLQPVKTISSGSVSKNADGSAQPAGDEARGDVEPDDAETGTAVVETESTDDAPGVEPTDDADDVDSTDEDAAASTDDEPSATEEPEAKPNRTTIQAVGGWPQAGDTERAAEPDPDLKPAPEVGAETPEELEQQLSEEFGVVLETDSDLTGGSLWSSPELNSQTTARSVPGTEVGTSKWEPDESQEAGESPDTADSTTDKSTTATEQTTPMCDEADTSSDATEKTIEETDEQQQAAPDDGSEEGALDPTADRVARLTDLLVQPEFREEEGVVRAFVHGIESLDDITHGMLAQYRQSGDSSPVGAHVAADGSGERVYAYARNRTLRKAGLIEHVGGGRYRYRLPELVAEAFDARTDEGTLDDTVAAIEAATDLATR